MIPRNFLLKKLGSTVHLLNLISMIVSETDMSYMKERIEIKNLIHLGLIDEAIQKLNRIDQSVLS